MRLARLRLSRFAARARDRMRARAPAISSKGAPAVRIAPPFATQVIASKSHVWEVRRTSRNVSPPCPSRCLRPPLQSVPPKRPRRAACCFLRRGKGKDRGRRDGKKQGKRGRMNGRPAAVWLTLSSHPGRGPSRLSARGPRPQAAPWPSACVSLWARSPPPHPSLPL